MSYITIANQGLAAAETRNWDEAITKLSKALSSSTNPAWLLARSKALINKQMYSQALDDANLGFLTAYDRNKRELMIDAQYRRAVAYFRLGQLANADCCCLFAMRLAKGSLALEKQDIKSQYVDADGFWKPELADAVDEAKTDKYNKADAGGLATGVNDGSNDGKTPHAEAWRRASTLRMQILAGMARLPADDEARKPTVQQKPELKKLADVGTSKQKTKDETSTTTTTALPVGSAPAADTALRVQEFQSNTSMSVSIFSKGVKKDKLEVEFQPSAVRLNHIVYPGGQEGQYHLELWGGIVTSECKFSVTPNKVELTLVKKEAGKWPQLQRDTASAEALEDQQQTKQPAKAASEAVAAEQIPSEAPEKNEPAKTHAGPSYPSSSRTGPKNWDQIGADLEGDDNDNDVNAFFKQIYKNATPEQQRAMMKSFTESNGTSLSTDWSDVKDRKVETVPPEGVEEKKW